MIYRSALLAIFSFMLVQTAYAGTVTLTGTCSGSVLPGNYIGFSIVNSGNDSAVNMVVTPSLHGLSTYNTSYRIPMLGPGASNAASFFVYNTSYNGSYPDAFYVQYGQGASTFYAVFPCLVGFGSFQQQSNIAITNVTTSQASVKVQLQNTGGNTVNVLLYGFAPPQFNLTKQTGVTIAPMSKANVTLSFTNSQAPGTSYSMAVAASYFDGSAVHSALKYFTVTSGSGSAQQAQPQFDPAETFIVVAIAVIVALIAISVLRKRKSRRK